MKNKYRKILNIKSLLSGQTLIEVVLVIGLSAVILPALLTGFVASRNGTAQQKQRGYATALLKETEEAVKSVKNADWATFSQNGTYHTSIVSSKWTLAANSITDSNGITQAVIISGVNRDTNGAIVSSGGTLDPSTKKVVITISWSLPSVSSVTSTMYLTRTANQTYTETTQAQFNLGTKTGTAVVASAPNPTPTPGDGQVELAAGAGGDWCQPQQSILKTFDLPGQGVTQSISAISSATRYAYAYTTTGGNASGDAVDGLTIDNNANPPGVTNPSSNLEAKAYGIFVDNSNNYVYFNENNPSNHTVRIARSSDLVGVGYFDVPHTTGSSIFVSGNTGYTTAGSTLYAFDVTTINGSSSQTQLGSVSLDGTGNRVVVVGTNAYVATSNTTKQLDIINVSDPTNMIKTKSINLGTSQGAVDVFVNSSQTYAYIVTSSGSGQNFSIVDLTNTGNVYGYTTQNGMTPKALAVVSGNKAILVGQGGVVYQVFNVTNPAAATYCGGMSPAGVTSINAVAPIYQGGLAYSYILTDNSSAEFQIILGGSGGGSFSSSGTYESSTYDAGSSVAFNRFVATIAQPSSTTIKMQVAAAAVSGSCSGVSFTYVGKNGDPADYFLPNGGTISGTIPFGTYSPNYQNPAQCFRYKTWFDTSDLTQSPILYDVILNRSL